MASTKMKIKKNKTGGRDVMVLAKHHAGQVTQSIQE